MEIYCFRSPSIREGSCWCLKLTTLDGIKIGNKVIYVLSKLNSRGSCFKTFHRKKIEADILMNNSIPKRKTPKMV